MGRSNVALCHKEMFLMLKLICCVDYLSARQVACDLYVGGSRCDSDCIVDLESQLTTLLQDILQQTDRVTVMLFVFYVVRHAE